MELYPRVQLFLYRKRCYRALSYDGMELDTAFVHPHDLPAEAEPNAGPLLFCSKKGHKGLLHYLFRYTRPVVGYNDLGLGAHLLYVDLDAWIYSSRYSIGGIFYEIDEHLFQQCRIGLERNRLYRQAGLQLYTFSLKLRLKKGTELFNEMPGLDQFEIGRRNARQGTVGLRKPQRASLRFLITSTEFLMCFMLPSSITVRWAMTSLMVELREAIGATEFMIS